MNVFDYAMKMELQGLTIYQNLAAATQVAGLKTIFTGLAADEQKHYDLFRKMKEGQEWTMVDSRMLEQARTVFTELLQEKDRLGQLQDDIEAYRVGLKMEADSVRFYEDMAKKEPEQELVQLYLKLANEEKKHYNIIENICDFVMRPKYYMKWRDSGSVHD
jgi:rubrerythrin